MPLTKDWKWILNDDLLATQPDPPDAFNTYYPMLAFTESPAGSVSATPSVATDHGLRFFSPPNQPLSIDWGPGFVQNPPFVRVNILDSDPDVFLQVILERWTANLSNLRQVYTVQSSRLNIATPGARTFGSFITRSQPDFQIFTDGSTPQGSDRLVCRLIFSRDAIAHGAGPIIMETGTVDSFCEVPIKMGVSSIVWNTNVITFPSPPSEYEGKPRADRSMVVSQGGVPATSLRHLYDFVDARWSNLSDRSFEESLRAWYAWAARGRDFSFSLDVADNAFTTLDGGASSGQAAIPVVSGTAFVVGNSYLIRQDQGDEEEMIVVLTSTASLVTADANLQFSYGSGDILKSRDHHPKMVLLDNDYPVDENITTFDVRLRLREARS